MNKLPQITAFFWIMKICATTLGETAGDLLSMTLNVGYAISSLLLIGIFLVTLITQLQSKSHNPLLYWTVILSTSTAGTTMSDYMDRTLGLGYAKGSLILVSILLIILAFWKFTVGSLSVTNIKTLRVELLYWTAILFSNTLGTALGDFLADSSGLGFAGGALLIAFLIALVLAAYYFTQISPVLLFWIAFVLTRPLGATMGDFLTKTHEKGGLGYGTVGSSIVLLSILIVCIVFTTLKHRSREII
ncbi:MAG: membrane protein [Pleurocapsa sp.]